MKNKIFFLPIIFFLLDVNVLFADITIDNYGKIEAGIIGTNYFKNDTTSSFNGNSFFIDNLKINSMNSTGFMELKGSYFKNKFDLVFNKAYIAYQNEYLTLEMGKDRIVDGIGFAWNPADILNPKKSPLYRDDEKRNGDEGIILSRVSFFNKQGSHSYEIRGILVKEDNTKDSKGTLAIKSTYKSLETFFTSGFQKNKKNINAGFVRFPMPRIDSITIYSEFQNTEFKNNWKNLYGIQLSPSVDFIKGNLFIQLEYFSNENGYKKMPEEYLKNSYPIIGETLKNYLFTGLGYNYMSYRFGAGFLQNIDNDKSSLINFLTSINISDETTLNIGGYHTIGDGEKEFPLLSGTRYELYLSVSVYFNSFFEK